MPRGRHNKLANGTVETAVSVHIQQVVGKGMPASEGLSILFLPSGQLRITDGAVLLTHRYRVRSDAGWQTVEQRVPICWTPCRFGGRRPWFMCNTCGRRAAKLYFVGPAVGCRRCCRLVYQVQRKDRVSRILHRADKIRERLSGEPGKFRPLPAKPKWMRTATYDRLRREVMTHEIRADQMIEQRLAAWAAAHADR
jgi:hypothetical protein